MQQLGLPAAGVTVLKGARCPLSAPRPSISAARHLAARRGVRADAGAGGPMRLASEAGSLPAVNVPTADVPSVQLPEINMPDSGVSTLDALIQPPTELPAFNSDYSSASSTAWGLVEQLAAALGGVPPEAVVAGGAVLALGLGAVGLGLAARMGGDAAADGADTGVAEEALPRENAVMVVGATGRTGTLVVKELLAAGRTVVAAVRNADKAVEKLGALGLQLGRQPSGGILFVEGGVDVAEASILSPELFQGVTQVACCVGPVFGETPEGGRGFAPNSTPEQVDAGGVAALVAAAKQALEPAQRRDLARPALVTSKDIAGWERLDDVIMGGKSSSATSVSEAKDGEAPCAVWAGELVEEGGGFCGCRSELLQAELGGMDGLALRVAGDGQTYKVNLKTADQVGVPEATYQARFETGTEWEWIYLPWHAFVPTKMAQYDPQAPPLDASKIRQLGLVLSRFSFNSLPNENYRPGKFELKVQEIAAYKDPRPQVVLVSSAGVERNAIVGDDAEARAKEIPIVQLNPGGILNFKYEGEVALRSSGLAYSIVRATGLTDDSAEPALLEASQGDRISGLITRAEVAGIVVSALGAPSATGKTYEVRRGLGPEAAGRAMTAADYMRLHLSTVMDKRRTGAGLPPMPKPVQYVPPPPKPAAGEAPIEEATEEAATVKDEAPAAAPAAAPAGADAAVVTDAAADIAARKAEVQAWVANWRAKAPAVKTAETPAAVDVSDAAADIATRKADAQTWIANWRGPAPVQKAAETVETAETAAARAYITAARKQEAQAWIAAWRTRSSARAVASSAKGVDTPPNVADAPPNVAEAREWIRQWRIKQLEAKLPANSKTPA